MGVLELAAKAILRFIVSSDETSKREAVVAWARALHFHRTSACIHSRAAAWICVVAEVVKMATWHSILLRCATVGNRFSNFAVW